MKNWSIGIAVIWVALVGCTERFEPPAKQAEPPKPAAKPARAPDVAKPKEIVAPADARPEPTTPEEIQLARKAALLDGRADDAVKYCGLEGLDTMGEQGILGCVLAACRIKDVEHTKTWGAKLSGALKKEAIKVCHGYGMSL